MRRRGSEAGGEDRPGWAGGLFKKREKSVSAGGAGAGRSPSTDSTSPPAKGSKKEGRGGGVVTGSLRISVPGGVQHSSTPLQTELDIPYIEDTREPDNRVKANKTFSFCPSLMRLREQ